MMAGNAVNAFPADQVAALGPTETKSLCSPLARDAPADASERGA
jgi:hypothetical protein